MAAQGELSCRTAETEGRGAAAGALLHMLQTAPWLCATLLASAGGWALNAARHSLVTWSVLMHWNATCQQLQQHQQRNSSAGITLS